MASEKALQDLCAVGRRTKYSFDGFVNEDANGVLVHPWTKLRLGRTSCPPIAGYCTEY
ncbi:MAG: hypothetical protein K2N15_00505 [Lachnospiraceae bacterium]|nr:hypothetical protein [Lachnospiraceae bacterium]